jgi:beta-galactosidase GanA
MQTVIVSAALSSLLAIAAQADLVVESKIESPQMNSTMTMKIRGDKIRTDVAGGPMGSMSVIVDNQSGDSVSLMHGPKMAMKTSAADMKRVAEMAKQFTGGATGDAAKPNKTGKTEKVGDYDCDVYSWTSGGMSGRYWVAKGHPQEAILKEAEKKMNAGIMAGAQTGPDTSALPGAVLKTETIAPNQTTVVTIVSIKEQKLDDKTFDVPADYKAMAMPQMPGFGGPPAGDAPAPGAAPIPRPAPRGAPPAPAAK